MKALILLFILFTSLEASDTTMTLRLEKIEDLWTFIGSDHVAINGNFYRICEDEPETNWDSLDTYYEFINTAVIQGMVDFYNTPVKDYDSINMERLKEMQNSLDTIRVADTTWVEKWYFYSPKIIYRDSTVSVCDTLIWNKYQEPTGKTIICLSVECSDSVVVEVK